MAVMKFSIEQHHPDLKVLCQHTNTKTEHLRGAVVFGVECNYLKVFYLRDWSDWDIKRLKEQFILANQQTKEYTFEFIDQTDYELEYDCDNYHPAAFTFKSIKKQ